MARRMLVSLLLTLTFIAALEQAALKSEASAQTVELKFSDFLPPHTVHYIQKSSLPL